MRFLVPAEPGELPLGVLTGAEFDFLRRGLDIAMIRYGIGQLLVADGLHGGGPAGDPHGQEIPNLLGQPLLHHPVHPPVDAVIEGLAVLIGEGDGEGLVPGRDGPGLSIVLGDGLPGLIPDLQGPDDALLVVGVELFSGLGVDALQVFPQVGQPPLGGCFL